MMITIHGLPTNTKSQDLRAVIIQECKITDFILDNLAPDGNGLKKVRVGLANDSEGNQVMKNLNGYCLSGHILHVTTVGKSGEIQSQQLNNFPTDQTRVNSWNNQLPWSMQQQQFNQYNYQQMNSYPVTSQYDQRTSIYDRIGPHSEDFSITQKCAPQQIPDVMNQYDQRTSVYDRVGPPCPDFSIAQKSATQQKVAPTMTSEQDQVQWSANIGTYQNNIPFYQQQSLKSPKASAFALDACASVRQDRRGDIQHQNISYPEKTTQAASFDKEYNWFSQSKTSYSTNQDGRVNRDASGKIDDNRNRGDHSNGNRSRNEQQYHALVDRDRRVNPDRSGNANRDRHGNRVRDTNRDCDRNRDHDGNRNRDRNRDRDVIRDRDGNRDRDVNRDRDGNWDRDGNRDRDRNRDRDLNLDRDTNRDRDGNRDRDRNRDRDGNLDRDTNRDRDGNRHRDGNLDRDGNRDRDVIRDRDGNRHRDGNRDRCEIRDRHENRDRFEHHDHNTSSDKHRGQDARPTFSCHDSARNRNYGKADTDNLRESRWDTHVRNQREWESNNQNVHEQLIVSVKNEQFKNSSSIKEEFKKNEQILKRSNSSNKFNASSQRASGSFGRIHKSQTNNQDRNTTQPRKSYQDNTLKRKYDHKEEKLNVRPSTEEPYKKFKPNTIVSTKMTAPTSLPKRLNRHTTWVQQVSSSVAKQVLESAGKCPKENRVIFVELKKCILNRINMVYGNNLANTMDEIITEYNKNFNPDQNNELYEAIRVISESKTKFEKPSSDSVKSDAATVVAPQAQTPNVSEPVSTCPSFVPTKTPHSIKPVTQNKKTPPANVNLLSKTPTRVVADIKLPKYPLNEQKQADKLGVILDLSEPYKSIVKDHTNEIENMATECCKAVDIELGASNRQFWQGAVSEIKKLLRMHLTNRLLNVKRNLGVRIFYKPTKPKRESLEVFLKQYDVISLKNSDRKKMLVVQCSTYKGFDNLCRQKTKTIGDITLTFKPLHLVVNPKKSSLKNGEMIVEQSESESDDDNEKLNKDIAECQQDILNNTDVVLLETVEEIIDVDKIQSTDIQTCSQNSGHKIIETNEDKREENVSNSVTAANIDKYGNDKEKGKLMENIQNGNKNCDQSKDVTNTFEKDDVIISDQNLSTGVVIRDGETEQNKYTITDTIVENDDEKQDSPPLIEDVDNEKVRNSDKVANIEDGIADDIDEDDLEDF
ncbi:unnamed protein product [Pieris macdunnoughi]|uniref:RRM domain-containing protein n=1 Tax=Pieris macdunnoughi TaxID=345717 RepID=A0A821XL98_9NEOP|nr:unnamed protein product [Pieris macdunnoughi]